MGPVDVEEGDDGKGRPAHNVPSDRGDTPIKGLACQPARAEAHTKNSPPQDNTLYPAGPSEGYPQA